MSVQTPPHIEKFLLRPLIAHLATNGPTVRPVWFLWEEDAFWLTTGAYSQLPQRLATDRAVALVVDLCNLETGDVLEVRASGEAEVTEMDTQRVRRLLTRYLGRDLNRWPANYRRMLAAPDTRLVRIAPNGPLEITDLSYVSPQRWPQTSPPEGI